jgi:hypothetical protein
MLCRTHTTHGTHDTHDTHGTYDTHEIQLNESCELLSKLPFDVRKIIWFYVHSIKYKNVITEFKSLKNRTIDGLPVHSSDISFFNCRFCDDKYYNVTEHIYHLNFITMEFEIVGQLPNGYECEQYNKYAY